MKLGRERRHHFSCGFPCRRALKPGLCNLHHEGPPVTIANKTASYVCGIINLMLNYCIWLMLESWLLTDAQISGNPERVIWSFEICLMSQSLKVFPSQWYQLSCKPVFSLPYNFFYFIFFFFWKYYLVHSIAALHTVGFYIYIAGCKPTIQSIRKNKINLIR